MVPGAGLEPARLATRDFKSLVSTDFTTRAVHCCRPLSHPVQRVDKQDSPVNAGWRGCRKNLEARPGVEPGYTDLQSVA